MPLIPTSVLMNSAVSSGRGIGAFNVVHLETAEALAAAAESSGLPVILQVSQNCAEYHGGLEPISRAIIAIAEASAGRIALHLDHAEDETLARQAVDLGYGSVMYDGGALDYAANVAATVRVADYARANGVFVEAELGRIGGKDGAHAPGVRTDPAEAVAFVADTRVDALAVAVGSSHAMAERVAIVDLELIAELHRALPVPLVLHGSSGVADDLIVDAITAGMTKINVSTQLNRVFTAAIRDYLGQNLSVVDSRKYLAVGREALAAEAARLLILFSSKAQLIAISR